MATITEGTVLWEPSDAFKEQSTLRTYQQWLADTRGLTFDSYEQLWEWSVTDLDAFWASIWEYFRVEASTPYVQVLTERTMPGARWFVDATLNYAEHVFRNASSAHPAIISQSERHPVVELSWDELQRKVGAIAAALRGMGVAAGDRVVAYVPTIPEAVIAFLACASIGAIWSSCSPDFGSAGVIDRFQQIAPKVLVAVDGYQYNGKLFDRRAVVKEIQEALPSLEQTIIIRYLEHGSGVAGFERAMAWDDLQAGHATLSFQQVPFDHPLWVLYSSGTTGLPKPIVHGQGGMLLEHLKALSLHCDLKPGDRFFWFTTTGWMMWNFLIIGLTQLTHCAVLYCHERTQSDRSRLH